MSSFPRRIVLVAALLGIITALGLAVGLDAMSNSPLIPVFSRNVTWVEAPPEDKWGAVSLPSSQPTKEVQSDSFYGTLYINVESYVLASRVIGFVFLDNHTLQLQFLRLGDQPAPGLTIVIIASPDLYSLPLRDPSIGAPPESVYPYSFGLVGSNTLQPGWSERTTVTIKLVGDGSLFDATMIRIQLVPFIPP